MNILQDMPLYHRSSPEELLGFSDEWPEGHPDFYDYGWYIFEPYMLHLCGEHGQKFRITGRCLTLVLHSTDDPPKQEEDVQLGFWLDKKDIPYLEEEIEARVSLNKWIDNRIEEVVDECRKAEVKELILCVCNPHHATILRSNKIPDDIRVYAPKGRVEHWKFRRRKGERHRRVIPRNVKLHYELRASEWNLI